MSIRNINIGIIDDHQILINGLSSVLEKDSQLNIIFQETKGSNVLNQKILDTIDVLLLDIEMPEIDGIELSKKILNIDPTFKILILSMYNETELVVKLREIGVKGFLSKNTAGEKLIQVVKSIHTGNTYFEILKYKTEQSIDDNVKVLYSEKIKELSTREKEILKCIIEGYSNQQIGEQLFISHRTVDTHRTNLMKKLEVKNVASLVRVALKSGQFI